MRLHRMRQPSRTRKRLWTVTVADRTAYTPYLAGDFDREVRFGVSQAHWVDMSQSQWDVIMVMGEISTLSTSYAGGTRRWWLV